MLVFEGRGVTEELVRMKLEILVGQQGRNAPFYTGEGW